MLDLFTSSGNILDTFRLMATFTMFVLIEVLFVMFSITVGLFSARFSWMSNRVYFYMLGWFLEGYCLFSSSPSFLVLRFLSS